VELARLRALPASVLGLVDFRAFCLRASSWNEVDMIVFPFSLRRGGHLSIERGRRPRDVARCPL
jgi:hypothetical protein